MTKILMVCLGNICRSPLAEGILKSMVPLGDVLVDSAGTAGYHEGNGPDPRSVAVAKQNGVDISLQKSRKFGPNDFKVFDHIYVMDKANYRDVVAQASSKEEKEKVRLLLSETDLPLKEVPDPYYGGSDGFEHVYALIEGACRNIAKTL